jgi:hypothetical protein
MSHANRPLLRIEPVGPDDQDEALSLVFGDLEPPLRTRHVAQLRAQYVNGPIEGLWAAYRGQRMVGAMRAAAMAGKAAIVTVPRVASDEPPETARELLARAVESLMSQGVRLAQALLTTDHGPEAEVLLGGEFRHAWDLLYLVSMPSVFPDGPPAGQLDFVPYSSPQHRQLVQLVERTYAGSIARRSMACGTSTTC